MTIGHLVDTCAAELLYDQNARAGNPKSTERLEAIIREGGGLHLSELTAFEIRRGLAVLKARGCNKRTRLVGELFIRRASLHPLSKAWNHAVELYVKGQLHKPAVKLSDADLLIFATAMAVSRRLVTRDKKLANNLEALGFADQVVFID